MATPNNERSRSQLRTGEQGTRSRHFKKARGVWHSPCLSLHDACDQCFRNINCHHRWFFKHTVSETTKRRHNSKVNMSTFISFETFRTNIKRIHALCLRHAKRKMYFWFGGIEFTNRTFVRSTTSQVRSTLFALANHGLSGYQPH